MNAFDRLYGSYVFELREALGAANEWWAKLQVKIAGETSSKEEAARIIEARWPFGPSSHPFVLAVFRKYYLSVVAINEEIETHGHADGSVERNPPSEDDWGIDDEDDDNRRFEDGVPIAPWLLLVDALHGEDEDLVDAVVWLVYQPVGLDASDHVV